MTIRIKVPATTANIGPGFDSLGVAVNLYLTLDIIKPANTWYVHHDYGDTIPHNEQNFIVKTALKICASLPPHEIKVTSDIPLARGLGSSSSALLAGIALANVLGQLILTSQHILEKATQLEGHPDNVAPALLGGAVAAYYDNSTVYHASFDIDHSLRFVTFIPHYEMLTETARAALPASLSFQNSVQASAIANTLVAALTHHDLNTASRLMELDQFHEVYRQSMVPHLQEIRQVAHQLAIHGTFLSGAGPTTITVTTADKVAPLIQAINQLNLSGDIHVLQIDPLGLQITGE